LIYLGNAGEQGHLRLGCRQLRPLHEPRQLFVLCSFVSLPSLEQEPSEFLSPLSLWGSHAPFCAVPFAQHEAEMHVSRASPPTTHRHTCMQMRHAGRGRTWLIESWSLESCVRVVLLCVAFVADAIAALVSFEGILTSWRMPMYLMIVRMSFSCQSSPVSVTHAQGQGVKDTGLLPQQPDPPWSLRCQPLVPSGFS
jgi:hypothetical protein